MRHLPGLLLLLALLPGPSAAAPRLQVAVSIAPLGYLVSRIAGDAVAVEVMIPPGASPETHAPSPRSLAIASRSSLYFLVGHPHFVFERTNILPLLRAHPEIEVVALHALDRNAGSADPTTEAEIDAHVWLAPSRMRLAAQRLADALAQRDPERAERYRAGLERLQADIDDLDREIHALLPNGARQPRHIWVFHPAWGWFAREYGLVQVAVEHEGKQPGPRRLIPLIEQARSEAVRTLFVTPGRGRERAEVLAREIGAQIETLDPLAADWLANLRHCARRFAAASTGKGLRP